MHYFKQLGIILAAILIFSPVIITNAGQFKDYPKMNSSIISSSSSLINFKKESKKLSPKVIIDKKGRRIIDLESDVKMNKNQETDFEKCKIEESSRRTKRNQNKPTSCQKVPEFVTDELTNQDYTVLFDKIQEKIEKDDGKNMNVTLPLEDFIDIKNLEVVSDLASSSAISSISDQSSNLSLTSISSSTLSSSTSSILSSMSAPAKISSKAFSFLDFLNPVKVDAVGNAVGKKVNDYRLPYPINTKIQTYRVMNDVLTHNNRNALDLGSFKNSFEEYNSDILAAKPGKVVVTTTSSTGFGNHVVIKQIDGDYAVYGHLSSISAVVDQNLNRSDKIGVQGQTGNAGGVNHLHFEVLDGSVASQTGCSTTQVFGSCYTYSTDNSYKVVPQFDECFTNRGGADELECKETINGSSVNAGYPVIAQSRSGGYWWTSINSGVLPTTQNVLFRDVNSGNNSIWKFANTTHTGDTSFPNNVGSVWQVAGFGDFNGDGYKDIMWRNSNNGQNVIWVMKNGDYAQNGDCGGFSTVGLDYFVAGIGDFNGDGYSDILWRNTSGQNVIWNMKGCYKSGDTGVFSTVPTTYQVVSVADFNNDGKADIFWRKNNGENVIWNMDNGSVIQNGNDSVTLVGPEYLMAGTADFGGDGKIDILWRNTSNGANTIWNMNNRSKVSQQATNTVGNNFIVGGLGDFDQDGRADIFWRSQDGNQNVIWNMDSTYYNYVKSNTQVGSTGASSTQVKGIFAK